MTARRRPHGDGSLFPWRKAGEQVGWAAQIDLGYGPDGKRRRRTVYGRTQREVLARLQGLKRDQVAGRNPALVTVEQWLTRWLDQAAPDLKPAAIAQYRWCVRSLLIPELGTVKLQKLTPSDVDAALRRLEGRFAPRSRSQARIVLGTALKAAMREGLLDRNVAALAHAVKVPHQELQVLDTEQAGRFLAAVKDDRLYGLWATLLALGLRSGEARGVRWRDLDLEGPLPELRVTVQLQRFDREYVLTEPKSPKSRRRLPLPAWLVEVLQEQRRRQMAEQAEAAAWLNSWGLAFTTPYGEPLNAKRLWNELRRHLAAAGLPPMRVHDLRHSAVSALFARQVPLELVSSIVGHSSVTVTADLYRHLLPESREAAREAFGKVLPIPGP